MHLPIVLVYMCIMCLYICVYCAYIYEYIVVVYILFCLQVISDGSTNILESRNVHSLYDNESASTGNLDAAIILPLGFLQVFGNHLFYFQTNQRNTMYQ